MPTIVGKESYLHQGDGNCTSDGSQHQVVQGYGTSYSEIVQSNHLGQRSKEHLSLRGHLIFTYRLQIQGCDLSLLWKERPHIAGVPFVGQRSKEHLSLRGHLIFTYRLQIQGCDLSLLWKERPHIAGVPFESKAPATQNTPEYKNKQLTPNCQTWKRAVAKNIISTN